ncbi:serine/threonine-protein kinase [Streptosporangium sp. 'caverna']|uniref:serine/threonine-protein kinase n=1 Tax=Streptosporangium sp. 'caverna' TaxID=2202249 RepID=UPI0013A6A678|nr:serine/threonine-protein kinase [Streptosporangium sp. 'caverna']
MTAYGLPTVLNLEPADPTELGPYRIAGRLGRGGMGTVYLAEGPSGPVAIKVINQGLTADSQFVVRFRNEVAAARKVSRFCTAPVLDAQLDEEPLWVVTEYVAGPNLAQMLRDRGPLDGANLEALAVGVALALSAIHGAGIVHRDLKPANVLLSPLGPRVIDFGIARALDAGYGQTATGQFLGTPEYTAPERIIGEKAEGVPTEPPGPPADIFAWGCVVVAAATGESPFASRNHFGAFQRVLNDVPNLDALDPNPKLRDLVEAALNKDPALRPTAEALLSGLVGQHDAKDTAKVVRTVRLNLTGLIPRITDNQSPAEPSRGRRPMVAAGAVAGILLAAVTAVLGIRMLSQGPPASTDVLYQDDFAADDSGWYKDAGTRLDTPHGYTGDGRYTMSTDGSTPSRTNGAPVNAESPEGALVTVRIGITSGEPYSGWAGVYCDYSPDDTHAYYYTLEIRPDGRARIHKATDTTGWDMTPDILVPDFRKEKALLRAECSRDGGEMRLGFWVDDHLVAEVVDAEAGGATGKPRFGLSVAKRSGASEETRAYFDDFEIDRLS